MIRNQYLRRFLGLEQIGGLRKAVLQASVRSRPQIESWFVLICVLTSLLPIASWFIPVSSVDLPTVFIGFAALLAVVFRLKMGLFLSRPFSINRNSMSLTHTAFGLGCIPAVFVLIFYPEGLYQLEKTRGFGAGPRPGMLELASFILGVSLWAGVTEELIYRGLLVSAIRRWKIFKSPRTADLFAIFGSSFVFAASHLPAWGLPMSIALFGLGAGLASAYVAVGEALLPIIIYHVIFDALSLYVAVIWR